MAVVKYAALVSLGTVGDGAEVVVVVVVEVIVVVVVAVVEVKLAAVLLVVVDVGMISTVVIKTMASVAPNVSPLVVVGVLSVVLSSGGGVAAISVVAVAVGASLLKEGETAGVEEWVT